MGSKVRYKINRVRELTELAVPPGNRLERQHSIRINDRFRVCITQTELANRLGISFPRLNEVVHAKRAVTPDTALRLARVVGTSADFWLGLQLDWDLWHAMHGSAAEEIAQLEPLRRSPG